MIRKVKLNEIDRVMKIIDDAKELLSHESLQWQQGYPNKDILSNDINNEHLYGYYQDNILVGFVALVPGFNKDYETIDGKWDYISGDSDIVIHRIAVKKEYYHKKIGDSLIKFAIDFGRENKYKSIKIDTMNTNKRIRALSLNNNFKFKGVIKIVRNEINPYRDAYEYIIKDE